MPGCVAQRAGEEVFDRLFEACLVGGDQEVRFCVEADGDLGGGGAQEVCVTDPLEGPHGLRGAVGVGSARLAPRLLSAGGPEPLRCAPPSSPIDRVGGGFSAARPPSVPISRR